MLELADGATADDRILFMFSGGGSALLCAPIDGVTQEQKQDITRHLLYSGATIQEINLVRKHLSRIKGGGLAACGSAADMRTYVISDVVGDDPADVASGPSIGVTSDVDAVLDVFQRYDYACSADLEAALRANVKPRVEPHPVIVAATAKTALSVIAGEVDAKGWKPVIVGEDLEGDATEIGREHAALATRHRSGRDRTALISGGELTVKVTNPDGRGGPNLEYLTSLLINLDEDSGVEALACDSDGLDGSEDNAGGIITPTSKQRAAAQQLDPQELLAENNSYPLFEALGDLVITGPTQTNVNDIRVILVEPVAA